MCRGLEMYKDELAIEHELQRRITRICVPEIAARLNIGRGSVYEMLEQGIIPAIRVGRRWIITRHAYEEWERTCGMRRTLDLSRKPEVTVN